MVLTLRELLDTLSALPRVKTTDLPEFLAESTRTFDLLIDFLRTEEAFSHSRINALATLCWKLIGWKEIPVVLDPFEGKLGSLHFLCIQTSSRSSAFFALPYGYLDLVRADPLMQLCAMVNMASQGCDYYARRLDFLWTGPRAQAYEAELLLALQPRLAAQSLSGKVNAYSQEVLEQYPEGLLSLPADQRYAPPIYSERQL